MVTIKLEAGNRTYIEKIEIEKNEYETNKEKYSDIDVTFNNDNYSEFIDKYKSHFVFSHLKGFYKSVQFPQFLNEAQEVHISFFRE